MAGRGFRGDWVRFAAVVLLLAGACDALQGLIAIVRNQYYSLDPQEILVIDLTAWGWLLAVWGLLVGLTGVALWFRWNAARWVAVVVVVLNLIVELAFAGVHNYPLWGLLVNGLAIFVLYALVVCWDRAEAQA